MVDSDPERVVPDPPSGSAPLNKTILDAGTPLYRVYRTPYGPAQFNSSSTQRTRFAPITDVNGTIVPVLYAGGSLAGALFESVFHEMPPPQFAMEHTVAHERIHGRFAAALRCERTLTLASLTRPDLYKLGLERRTLIDTTSSQYQWTALWAKWIHNQDDGIDGLSWTSRQNDAETVYVFFGDRVRGKDLVIDRQDIDLCNEAYPAVVGCAVQLGVSLGEPDPK